MVATIREPIRIASTTRRDKINAAFSAVTQRFNASAGFELARDEEARAKYLRLSASLKARPADKDMLNTQIHEHINGELATSTKKLARALALRNTAHRLEVLAKDDTPLPEGLIPAFRRPGKISAEAMLLRVLLTERNWVALARLSIAHVMITGINSTNLDKNLAMAWASISPYHREVFQDLAKQLDRVHIPGCHEFVITGAMQQNWDPMSVSSRVALFSQ